MSRTPELLAAFNRLNQNGAEQELEFFLAQDVFTTPEYQELGFNFRVIGLITRNRLEDALAVSDHALSHYPDAVGISLNKAVALKRLGRFQDALNTLLTLPDVLNKHVNLSGCYLELQRHEQALFHAKKALDLGQSSWEANLNAGLAYLGMNDLESATHHVELAYRLAPRITLIQVARARLMLACGEYQAFEQCIERVENTKNSADYHATLGIFEQRRERFSYSVSHFEVALSLKPSDLGIQLNLVTSLMRLKDFAKARELLFSPAMLQYMSANPLRFELTRLTGDFCLYQRCEEDLLKGLSIANGTPYPPLNYLYYLDDPKTLKQAAARWSEYILYKPHAHGQSSRTISEISNNQRLVIAYISADYVMHPIEFLTRDLYKYHNRKRFEVIGIFVGPNRNQPAPPYAETFDRFYDIRGKSRVAQLEALRGERIDFLVDLGGYTKDNDPRLAVSIQARHRISYLGYLGTMGSTLYDFILLDGAISTPEIIDSLTEKPIILPTYQVNSPRAIKPKKNSRTTDRITFGSFNHSNKITPEIIILWAEILLETQGELIIYCVTEEFKVSVQREFESLRVSPSQIQPFSREPLGDYYRRLQGVDVMLDTFPHNGGTTTSDALYYGIPVVSRYGRTIQSRYSLSLLRAIDLNELAVSSFGEYKAVAIRMAAPGVKERYSERVIKGIRESNLYDPSGWVKNFEEALDQIE